MAWQRDHIIHPVHFFLVQGLVILFFCIIFSVKTKRPLGDPNVACGDCYLISLEEEFLVDNNV